MLDLFDSTTGRLNLSKISEADVLALSPDAQQSLKVLVEAVAKRETADERLAAARTRQWKANSDHDVALAEHQKANPPPSFSEIHAAAIESFNRSH